MRTIACLTLLGVGLSSPALAGPGHHGDSFGLSISPIHLLMPVVELQGEVLLTEGFSLAPIFGYGSITLETSSSSGSKSDETLSVLEVGAQARYYFYGSTQEGAHAGAEVLYVSLEGDVSGTAAVGDGLEIGPIVGYKWVWDAGFFIDLNGGVGFLAVKAETKSDSGSAEDDDRSIIPILNFNLGWAF